jgi:CheY-like chemotaxis protein
VADQNFQELDGRCVLVVEDEYLIAADLASVLESAGVNVIGPAGSVGDALELVHLHGAGLDGAVLDVNLREERVYPVAQALTDRGVPYIFTTGYDAMAIPESFASAPRHQKPVDQTALLRQLSVAVRRGN